MSPTPATNRTSVDPRPGEGSYRIPVVGATVPSGMIEKGFWGALVGSALLGAVELPLAALVGAGVVITRHGRGGGPRNSSRGEPSHRG
ncbi:MAG: hypothetical protein M0Z42_18590 [Actinomycetota bacterium]|jgi:hypothetical protein|nr:hypothetical protein [Actinomycetota bacterium]